MHAKGLDPAHQNGSSGALTRPPPLDRCPRSIPGKGFASNDKLVDHLKSSKPGHRLSQRVAVYQVSLRNISHLQAIPQTPSPSDFNDISADLSVQLNVSQVSFVQ
jgi:hypothetical protein